MSKRKRLGSYFEQSRDLLNSLLLVLPLLLLYQLGLLWTGGTTQNGVDFLTTFLVQGWGLNGLLVFNGLLLISGLVGLRVLKKQRRLNPQILVPVALESTIYALLLGSLVLVILRQIPGLLPNPGIATAQAGPSPLDALFISVGAGVNEELVFRLGIYSGLAWLLARGTERKGLALAGALIGSSVLFSLAHYMGSEGFALYTFAYRFVAGSILCGLFVLRGFAVAVYTHAIYDVYVLVFV